MKNEIYMNKPIKNALIGLGISFVVLSVVGLAINRDIASFLINVSTEIIGIIITVLIIDRIVQNHEVQMKKKLLLSRVSSDNNETAKEALDELRLNGWVEDGSLNGASLFKANLFGANLYDSVMIGSTLSFAVFERAYLRSVVLTNSIIYFTSFRNAELRGANLTGVRSPDLYKYPHLATLDHLTFVNAFSLREATMPDGTIYDGRYRLKGDVDAFHGIDSSPGISIEYDTGQSEDDTDENWASFYGVSIDEYRQGQLWAEKHLERYKGIAAPSGGFKFARDEE